MGVERKGTAAELVLEARMAEFKYTIMALEASLRTVRFEGIPRLSHDQVSPFCDGRDALV